MGSCKHIRSPLVPNHRQRWSDITATETLALYLHDYSFRITIPIFSLLLDIYNMTTAFDDFITLAIHGPITGGKLYLSVSITGVNMISYWTRSPGEGWEARI